PIEIRSLHKEGSHTAQGQVHMWLEIRPEREALREPRTVLEAPEKREFEVRVICWKTKDVPYESGDYYAEFQIGDSKKQCTDIHWRCRSGRASWNWRLKFPVELPLASPELGRLNVQLWDKDIIKWNDIIGQSQLDLYRWLLKAYRENRAWLKMTYKDQKRHRVYHRGAIAISVEILPKEDAENRPAGHGIAEPNQNPTLPP
ncbi:hypothetical protein AURANDRAFT_14730, partial [Aureococcus anophagefferens]